MSTAIPANSPGPPATQAAIAAWDNEGGAGPSGPQLDAIPVVAHPAIVEPTAVELVHLRTRVIALENLMIALLAEASDRQLRLAREMADFISPRPGFTQHPLTLHAAIQMTNLIERAGQFRA